MVGSAVNIMPGSASGSFTGGGAGLVTSTIGACVVTAGELGAVSGSEESPPAQPARARLSRAATTRVRMTSP
ncbi:hypothetical protein [Rhodococcus sp. MTM3W5.2]|uniref:hypothetical protein n=1 Tax=Rhodococcus sp. MTM3W5.2 TaxID=1805827 RepID=UPI0016799AE3|nr:hypothetical protein [Rhodococcus sp. MTM3W5.2]